MLEDIVLQFTIIQKEKITMTTTNSNLPTAYVLKKKNSFVQEYVQSWGAKTEGIEPGHYIEGIVLGFEVNEFNMKHIILRQLHDGSQIKIWGCTSLQKQLHQEQVAPFNTLIYNVGDVIRVIYTGSFVAKKGMAMGKTIACFQIFELDGYRFTENDAYALEQYQMQQAYKNPAQTARMTQQRPQQQSAYRAPVAAQPKPLAAPKVTVTVAAASEDDDSFDI